MRLCARAAIAETGNMWPCHSVHSPLVHAMLWTLQMGEGSKSTSELMGRHLESKPLEASTGKAISDTAKQGVEQGTDVLLTVLGS